MAVQPVHVGGHWQIVNVGWGGGYYVVVNVEAEYTSGTPGSRTGDIILTVAGVEAGGVVVAQKNIHEPEVLGPEPNPHPARSKFLAVIKFKRPPAGANETGFTLELEGSIKVTDPVDPTTGEEPFCGVSTATGAWGPYYSTPIPGSSAVNIWQDVTWTTSTPAGTSTLSFTNGPLADVKIEQIGSGAFTITGSDSEIWYRDSHGNYINTHRPCSELPPPGSPPEPATKTEGWYSIQVTTYLRQHQRVTPSSEWTFESNDTAVIQPKDDKAFGGFLCQVDIPRPIVGLNSDFLPIFDDLPEGSYDFRVATLTFSQFAAQKPPQKQTDIKWALFSAYPKSPGHAKYSIRIGTNKPPPYTVHLTAPDDEQLFPPGIAPPSNQSFTS
jgi:hypothetical protein